MNNFKENIEKMQLIFVGLVLLIALIIGYSANLSILLFALVAIIFIAAYRIEIGVFLLTAYIPFEVFLLKFTSDEIYPFLKYGTEIALLILLVFTLVKYVRRNGYKRIKTPIDVPLIIFVFITFISAVLNLESPLIWVLGLRQLLRYVILYYVIIYNGFSKKTTQRLVVLLIILVSLQAIIGLGQSLIGPAADKILLPSEHKVLESAPAVDFVNQFWVAGQRVFATLGRYDRLGVFLCFGLLIASALLLEFKKKSVKYILGACFLICVPTLILTYSRMSWLGFIFGFFVMGVLIARNKKVIISFITIIAVISLYLGSYIIANQINIHNIGDQAEMSIASRALAVISLSEIRNSYRSYGRLYFIIKTPSVVVKNYPLFGVGLGQYGSGVAYAMNNRDKYDELGLAFGVEDIYGQIDNNWFSVWGETGTLGFIAFLFIFINLSIFSYRLYKNSQDDFEKAMGLAFLGVMAATSLQAFLGIFFELRPSSYNFWLLSGLVVNLGLNKKYEIKQ